MFLNKNEQKKHEYDDNIWIKGYRCFPEMLSGIYNELDACLALILHRFNKKFNYCHF